MAADYKIIVIGAGPAGQMAAKKAALMGRKVGVVDTMSGKLTPQSRMRRLMFHLYALEDAGLLSGLEKSPDAQEPEPDSQEAAMLAYTPDEAWVRDYLKHLFFDDSHDPKAEAEAVRKQMRMPHLDLLEGKARFLNIDELEVTMNDGKRRVFEPSNLIIATGSHYLRDESIPFDEKHVFDAKTIFDIADIPEDILIVGDQLEPFQFAVFFCLMGARVTLLVPGKALFEDLDEQIREELEARLKAMGIELVLNAQTKSVETEGDLVAFTHNNGSVYTASTLLWMAHRAGNTAALECEEAGVELDDKGNIIANESFQTSIAHIYAVGDVVRSPLYESARKAQGRDSIVKCFGLKDTEQLSGTYPVGIYALPEIAYYGLTQAQAKAQHLPYLAVSTSYRDAPYGQVNQRTRGVLKLIVHKETEEILGVHILGRGAQELIHFGMQLVEDKVRVRRLVGTVLNGTSLHELYHYAALEAFNKLR